MNTSINILSPNAVDDKIRAAVTLDGLTYGARFSPVNTSPTAGASIYTRTAWGHKATSATTLVNLTETNSIVGVFFSGGTTTFKIVSTSLSDAAAGTGIRTINIVYIGTDGARYVTSATMNGTTVVTVALSPSASVIQEVYMTSAGSGQAAAGTITVKDNGSATTMGQVATGNTRTISPYHCVPTGKAVYLRGARFSSKTTAALMQVDALTSTLSSGATVSTFNVDRWRAILGNTDEFYDPPICLQTAAGQIIQLNFSVTPDAATASDYWASYDLVELAQA